MFHGSSVVGPEFSFEVSNDTGWNFVGTAEGRHFVENQRFFPYQQVAGLASPEAGRDTYQGRKFPAGLEWALRECARSPPGFLDATLHARMAASTMTNMQLMDLLLDCFPENPNERDRIHRQSTYYVGIAELGYELFSTLLENPDSTWCLQFLDRLEQALQAGDAETRNLIAVGLFESLQSQSYQQGPPDLLESRMGPLSLAVWADLMEGWCGSGIRSVASWRASKV